MKVFRRMEIKPRRLLLAQSRSFVGTYLDLSRVEHHDLGAIHDGIEAVSNCEHSAVGKFLADSSLRKMKDVKKFEKTNV